MFLLVLPENGSLNDDPTEISRRLSGRGIELGHFELPLLNDKPRTPPLPGMDWAARFPHRAWWRTPHEDLRKRNAYEHVHTEDETVFCTEGSFLLFLNDSDALPPVILRVGPGCWYRIPKRTKHWLSIDPAARIQALVLFSDPTGWMPYFTQSGVEPAYEHLGAAQG